LPGRTQLIPQECHHEPAVRHAIFALSALYKFAAAKNAPIRAIDEHLDFALVQHSKAIASFRESLSNHQPRVRLAVMASLLFGCFESFHGSWETAAHQLNSGLSLLGHWERNRLLGKQIPTLVAIDPEIRTALVRLQLQLESYLAMYPMTVQPLVDLQKPIVKNDVPIRFSNLAEAFPFALTLATCAIRHSRRASHAFNLKAPKEDLEKEQDSLCDYVYQWKRAFRPLLLETETGQHIENQDYLGTLQLHTCVMSFEILVSTSLSTKETIFDRYNEQFRRIVILGRRLFEMDKESRKVDYLRVQFGLGLIMTLYYIATRCRDPSIRREAIAILWEWPSKNGVWDSLQAAQIAEWIVGIEEEKACGNILIPEEARVRMNSLKLIARKGGIEVECIQGHIDSLSRVRRAILEFT
jgi:hypothetical protein